MKEQSNYANLSTILHVWGGTGGLGRLCEVLSRLQGLAGGLSAGPSYEFVCHA